MTRVATLTFVPAVFALSFVLQLVNCTPSGGGGKDAGSSGSQHLCTSKPDCSEFEECVGGVCQRPCSTDDVCEFGQFCARTGYCQDGCRDTASCNDANKLCVDGACVDRSSVGTCGTKADCDATKVCQNGQCVSPPATCTGPQDCPGTGQCNGFTHACFDPAGECTTTADCSGKPQCSGGCTCSAERRCVASAACTVATEVSVCGAGSYCDATGHCVTLPVCQKQADCDAAGLSCNRTQHVCARAPTCTTATATTACASASPFTKCNAGAGYCQEPTCTNGGITCSGTTTCGSDGVCATGSGTACASNTTCPTGPPMQYCDSAAQQCRVGCRSDADCTSPQKCNAAHACAVPGGSSSGSVGGGDGDPCQDDSACRVGFVCNTFVGACRETCQTGSCPECPQTGYGCLLMYCVSWKQSTCGGDAGI